MRTFPLLLVLLLSSCGRAEREREAAVEAARAATLVQIESVLSETIRLADRLAGSADRILRPLPVMTPAEEDGLRRFLSAQHVARARALGVRVTSNAAMDSLLAAGRLIQLEDSTHHWIVRRGTSPAYVVPHLRTLLGVLGERFQGAAGCDGASALPPRGHQRPTHLSTSGTTAAIQRQRGRRDELARVRHDRGPLLRRLRAPRRHAPRNPHRRSDGIRAAPGTARRSGSRVGLGPQVTRVGGHLQPGAPGGASRRTGTGDLRTTADGLSPHGRQRVGGLVARQPRRLLVSWRNRETLCTIADVVMRYCRRVGNPRPNHS